MYVSYICINVNLNMNNIVMMCMLKVKREAITNGVQGEMKKARNKVGILFILASLVAVCIAVSVLAQPTTPLMFFGGVYYDTGLPVNNPDVTITNLNTSEVFCVETSEGSNYFQVATSPANVRAGNMLRFSCYGNGYMIEFTRGVTQEELNRGVLIVNLTLKKAQLAQFFDTGSSTKPYPSISGLHNGTITPKVTVRNVSTLYTYPCPGTGGHSEYVAFFNATTGVEIANGTWNGYGGDDWRNLSLPGFTMYADQIYKYSMRTGSYPQIIHKQAFTNEYGTINCTGFIDANGHSHVERIPAIRLEGDFVPAKVEYSNPKTAFSSYYEPINITVDADVPSYSVPITKAVAVNWEGIQRAIDVSRKEKGAIKENGFLILDYGNESDIVAPYVHMKDNRCPIFVTADTMLHLYYIQFSAILKDLEEREFFDELVGLSNAMLEQSKTDYLTFDDPALKEAARRNVAYFAVALELLQTQTDGYNGSEKITVIDFTVPDYVKEEVEKEIVQIKEHAGFKPGAVFNTDPNCTCDSPCCYCNDYSQYVPRGHYAQSEKLKRYFKAMMWYGQMTFLLKGCNGDDALISGQDANTSTIQAALIASELPEVRIGVKPAVEVWNRIYAVTAFFVGYADDLTPYEYANALDNVFGSSFNASDLSDETKLLALKTELAKMRSPAIYGGSGDSFKTKGMRVMGQRFVPDSYVFPHLVSPAVGKYVGNGTPFTLCEAEATRCLPRGLDVMDVLGSGQADTILIAEGDTEYEGTNTSYEIQLNTLKAEFADVNSTEWNTNLYWGGLYALKPLLTEFGVGYPSFMQTEAWQKKELQTSLASWTELRHDTARYARQNYTPPFGKTNEEGYVEPVPEFYARLLALTQMTEKGLANLYALNATDKTRLQDMARILERLITISVDELEDKKLSEDDYKYIIDFGETLNSTIGANNEGTTVVADVYSDSSTGQVLEEGVGYVKMVVVAYRIPGDDTGDDEIYGCMGPVFSYYEFTREDRLTDAAWKEMLTTDPPDEPEWVKGLYVSKEK